MVEFGVSTSEHNGFAVVAVTGQVDLSTTPGLRDALADVLAEGATRVVVDLSGADFLDSTALGALVATLKRLRAKDGELRLVCISPQILKVFEITSLDRVFGIHDTLDAATS